MAGDRLVKSARFVKVRGDRTDDEANLTRAQSLGRPERLRDQRAGDGHARGRSHREVPQLLRMEKSFRMSQSGLRGRPLFDYTRAANEAHLTIVFTPLAVVHTIQSRTGLSIAEVVKQLRPLRSATVNINGSTQTFPPAIPNAQRKILTDLGIKHGLGASRVARLTSAVRAVEATPRQRSTPGDFWH